MPSDLPISSPPSSPEPPLGRRAWLKRFGRRRLHDLVVQALRLRSQPYPMEFSPTTLVFAPHQDDATLGCGGLILRKRLDGGHVHVCYITDGSASHRQHPTLTPAALSVQRQAEARAAMRILGVENANVSFLNARDGSLDHLPLVAANEVVRRIAALCVRLKPDEIFLPCRSDGSTEHDAAFLLVMRGLDASGCRPRIFEFPIWSWWNPRLLFFPILASRQIWRADFRGYERLKAKALTAYVSQVRPTPPWDQPVLPPDFVSFFSSTEEFFFEMQPSLGASHSHAASA